MTEARESANHTPLHSDTTPAKWVKDNLFNNVMNSIITVVLGVVVVFLLVQSFGWVAGEEWEIVRVNLRNFMVGQFPSDELWRLWTSAFLLIGTFGIGTAAMAHSAYDDANEKGLVGERPSLLSLLGRFWPVLAFIALMVSFSQTLPPVLGVIGGVGAIIASRFVGWALPASIRSLAVAMMAIGTIVAMAVLAGTGGLIAMSAGVVALAIAASELSKRVEGSDPTSMAIRTGGPIVIGAATWFAVNVIGFDGFGWEDWGGLHLTLFATVVGIASGMPIGILLAIGRRSTLPVIRGFCVVFIEFVRGVPLISLLLFSSFILPLLFPLSVETPETLTRAMIVIALFSAAYIAEIIRGGLQAVPKGQTEAAQASGMSAAKIQRLIVMPQALRAVIPAMVGQFISLFKDTSLIATIGVAEFFQFAAVANSQPAFLGKSLQLVTYSIIALGYWSFAYTMSKESRRLETQLGVGVR
ncbi:MAG: amino acid ABC transporter permease [Actinomycetota bacterium]|jgi:general L-amino acid transport system permease protein|uniref:amino acid ABC transporter permease n=1 Tax=uncultured Ilumatobacter sp. TaxID=879968 RepID=UPI00374EEC65|nr:amino acid ABC transporter permease [Actinomycetota bacterium]